MSFPFCSDSVQVCTGQSHFPFLIIYEREIGWTESGCNGRKLLCPFYFPLLSPCSEVFPLEELQFNYLLTLFFEGKNVELHSLP